MNCPAPSRVFSIPMLAVLLIGSGSAHADDSALLSGGTPKGTVLKGAVSKGHIKQDPTAKTAADDSLVETPSLPYVTLMVARDPAVQAELRLNRKQTDGVKGAVALVDEPFWQLRDVPVKQCGDKLDALLTQFQKKLNASLTPAELDRLDQLILQARGWKSLVSPEIARKLNLSADQVGKMRKVVGDIQNKRADIEKQGEVLSKAEQARLQETESANVHEVLSSRQREALTDLIGKPFDLSRLKRIGCVAPELRGVDTWINSEPLALGQLRGKVVVVHFWAFGCINCIHNLPHYKLWHERFRPSEVTIIGLHTPETQAEHSPDNLRRKVREYGINYPVAFDAAAENWKAWGNNMWPSVYLIDKQGNVRAWWTGELAWEGAHGEEIMRAKIEELLAEK